MYKIVFLGLASILFMGMQKDVQNNTSHVTNRVNFLDSLCTTNFAAFLSEVSKDDVNAKWPEIPSVSSIEKMPRGKEKELAMKWHELGNKVFEQLMVYPVSMPVIDSNKCFSSMQTVHDLIRFRNVLINRMSYDNLLIADTVNSVVFMDLTRRVVSGITSESEMEKAVQSLQDYQFDLNRLEQIAIDANGKSDQDLKAIALPVFATKEIRLFFNPDQDSELRRGRFYRVLIMTAGVGTIQEVWVKPPTVDRTDLFRQEDMFSLLKYYELTDRKMYQELPLLVSRWMDKSNPSNRSLVNGKLPLLETPKFGASVRWPSGDRAGIVENLTELVRSDDLDSSMGFSKSLNLRHISQPVNEDTAIQKTLWYIESAKEQLRLLKNLDVGAVITREDVEVFLTRKLIIPAGCTLVVGKVGEDAKCISPLGSVITRNRN